MNDGLFNEAKNIITGLNDKEAKKQVEVVQAIDPVDDLRLNIINFYKKMMGHIEQDEYLKKIVEEKLKDKIENDEMTTPQLMSLLKEIKNSSAISIEALFSVLKPVPNSSSFLNENKIDKGSIGDFNDLSDDQSRALETLSRVVLEYNKSKKEEKDKESKEKEED